MEEYLNLSRYDIENKLSNNRLMTSRIISVALAAGPLFFLLVILLLYLKNKPAGMYYAESNFMSIFIYAFILIAIPVYGAFLFLPQFFPKPEHPNFLSFTERRSRSRCSLRCISGCSGCRGPLQLIMVFSLTASLASSSWHLP